MRRLMGCLLLALALPSQAHLVGDRCAACGSFAWEDAATIRANPGRPDDEHTALRVRAAVQRDPAGMHALADEWLASPDDARRAVAARIVASLPWREIDDASVARWLPLLERDFPRWGLHPADGVRDPLRHVDPVLGALLRLGEPAWPVVARQLASPDAGRRRMALLLTLAFPRRAERAAERALAGVASDRLMGLGVLRSVDGPAALSRLGAALADPDEGIRVQAATWLSEWGDERGRALLDDVAVRAYMSEALGWPLSPRSASPPVPPSLRVMPDPALLRLVALSPQRPLPRRIAALRQLAAASLLACSDVVAELLARDDAASSLLVLTLDGVIALPPRDFERCRARVAGSRAPEIVDALPDATDVAWDRRDCEALLALQHAARTPEGAESYEDERLFLECPAEPGDAAWPLRLALLQDANTGVVDRVQSAGDAGLDAAMAHLLRAGTLPLALETEALQRSDLVIERAASLLGSARLDRVARGADVTRVLARHRDALSPTQRLRITSALEGALGRRVPAWWGSGCFELRWRPLFGDDAVAAALVPWLLERPGEMLALTADPDPARREIALRMLDAAPDDAGVARLREASRDPSPDVRATAISMLERWQPGRHRDVLSERLRLDRDERVVQAAARWLLAWGDTSAFAAVASSCAALPRPPIIMSPPGSAPNPCDLLARATLDEGAEVSRSADLLFGPPFNPWRAWWDGQDGRFDLDRVQRAALRAFAFERAGLHRAPAPWLDYLVRTCDLSCVGSLRSASSWMPPASFSVDLHPADLVRARLSPDLFATIARERAGDGGVHLAALRALSAWDAVRGRRIALHLVAEGAALGSDSGLPFLLPSFGKAGDAGGLSKRARPAR